MSATYQRLRNFLAYLTPERRSNYAGCLFAVRSHEPAFLMSAPLSLFCALQGLTLLTGCFVCGCGTVQWLVVAQVGEGTSRDVASDGMVQRAVVCRQRDWCRHVGLYASHSQHLLRSAPTRHPLAAVLCPEHISMPVVRCILLLLRTAVHVLHLHQALAAAAVDQRCHQALAFALCWSHTGLHPCAADAVQGNDCRCDCVQRGSHDCL